MFFVFKKEKLYNIIFAIGILISTVLYISDYHNGIVPTVSTPLYGKIIIIDAGHGTPDSGTTGVGGTREKDVNLTIAKKLGELYTKCGAHVLYTRENDGTIADNLDESIRKIKRNDMAKRKYLRDNSSADLFISIHMNFFEDSKYKGAQVFYRSDNEDSRALANLVQKHIKDYADNQNTRQASDSKNKIFILNDSKVPSILIECGFLSNPEEEKNLNTPSYQDKMAYAIFTGTLKFFSNT